MRTCFVILHYLAEDVTCRCLDSLLSLKRGEDAAIVLVDNCSPDGSGERLKRKYAGQNRVHFVMLAANEGFARGNNAGYRYAVEHFEPDFVVVMNNDVIIDDPDFITKIESAYKSKPFSVLGPDILSVATGKHQNPYRAGALSLKEARLLRVKMWLKRALLPVFYSLGHCEKPCFSDIGWRDAAEDCVLHGACLVFSRDFISARQFAFNPETFLYCEEDILHAECARESLAMRYSPDLKVKHLEDCSTQAASRTAYSKARRKYGNLVRSLGVLVGALNFNKTEYRISDNSRRVAKNTLFLYLRMLVLMFVGLFTSRIVLRQLGVSDFGIYNVVYGLVMMFTVVSNSVSNAVNRFLTFSIGQGDKARTHKIFSSSLIIMAGISLLLVLLVETLGTWYLNNRLVIPADRMLSAFWVLQCTALLLVVQLFSSPFNAVIIAHERMNVYAWISILEAVLKLTVALLLCFTGRDKLVLYSFMMVFVAIIIRTAYALYCRKYFDETSGKPEWDSSVLGSMLSFSGWSFLGNGVAVMNTRGMDLLSNSFFGVGVNAARGIALQVENIVKQFVANFLLALNPQIIKSWSSGNVAYCHEIVAKGCKFTMLILLMFAVPLCFEGETLLTLWLGTVPQYSVVFTVLSVFCVLVDMMANSVFQLIQATGKVAAYYVVTSSVNLLAFAGAWVLFAFGYGPRNSYLAIISAGLLADALKLAFAHRQTSLNVGVFLRSVLPGPLLAALSASAVSATICVAFPSSGLVRMSCDIVASVAVYCVTAYFMALTPGERVFVKDVANKFRPS